MKIEKITLCNLTSIEGEQTIDFTKEPLRSAGLFAITGDTGTGKSTILDAICLALYNRAPRFDDAERIQGEELGSNDDEATKAIQTNDVRNILRRDKKEGWSIVEYTSTDGARYEAGWYLRVKRTGNLDRVKRTLRQTSPVVRNIEDQKIAEEVVRTIGLDYMQFSRTVMLAQNSFANFLKARRKDKSELLEKLTGTDIYGRISRKIFEKSRSAKDTVSALQNEIKGLLHDFLCPDALAEAEDEKKLLSSNARNIADQQAVIHEQLKWYADYEETTRHLRECEARQTTAHKNFVAMRAEELQLKRYDDVLCIQPLYQEIIVRRRDIENLKQQELHSQQRIDESREVLKKKAELLEKANEKLTDTENKFNLRRATINRGHSLSGEISEVAGQLRKIEEHLVVYKENLQGRTNTLTNKREQLSQRQKDIENIQLHKQALSVHRLMFEKYDLVKDKLVALNTESRRNEESHKRFVELQTKQQSLRNASQQVQKKQEEDSAKMAALKGELFIHQQANHGTDSAELQKNVANLRDRMLGLQRAQSLWNRISSGYTEIRSRQQEQSRMEAEIAQLVEQIELQQKEKTTVEEAFKRLNVTFTLSQSQNIVQLRKQLIEGTACPVCGATHHPYHTETEHELGELLTNLEKEHTEMSEELERRNNMLIELRERLAKTEGRLRAEKENLAACNERLTTDVQEWGVCANLDASFADCSASVNHDARRMMIELLIDNAQKAVEERSKELEEFNHHQQHINHLNEEIRLLDSSMNDNRTYLDNLHTELQIAAAAAEETQKTIELSDRSCSELYVDLDEMVTLSGWFTEWKNNPDGFRTRLTSLHLDWQKTCNALDEARRAADILQEEVKSAETAEAEARKLTLQTTESHAATEEILNGKRNELKQLFGDTSPEEEEEYWQKALAETRAAAAAERNEYESANAALQQLQGIKAGLYEDRANKQADYQQKMIDMDVWILQFNGNHSPIQFSELEHIFSGGTDWNALRTKIDALKEELTLSNNILETAREALQKLRTSSLCPSGKEEETQAALRESLEELKARGEETAVRLAAVEARLISHNNCQRRADRLQTKLKNAETNYEQWERLSSLLGSADGKRFRELAQSYTFRFLVEHANQQLRLLSPRYRLVAASGSLNLEIIDRDMFDQRRYVHSLSGGETFVVSLALALGLSSLSSNNLSIGSLFIDEGFGNLDQSSLELVMTALANLENSQGRKVGVISHTEQIRSQISPQIRLVKLPTGGRSRIEIG